jgi:putative heme-binding domain-containing protein
MKLSLAMAFLVPVCLVPVCLAQANAGRNEGQIDQGKAVYRSNCAFCHGLTAQGGRGPSLTASGMLRSAPDDAIRNVITRGVPGTTMPAFHFEKDDMESLVGFLRSLSGGSGGTVSAPGDAKAGELIYSRNGCGNCHRIGNVGSIYGPELTRIGAGRSLEYLRESLVDPSADIVENYAGVTVVTDEGKRVSGVRVNEDTFSVQVRKPDQAFALFDKAKTKEVIYETKSMMPAYKQLSAKDLQDLLAYLSSLRGQQAAGAEANKAQGIH